MIAIVNFVNSVPCSDCSRMIDIDTSMYLDVIAGVMCSNCTKEHKINERDKKLNKVLRRGIKEKMMEWLR